MNLEWTRRVGEPDSIGMLGRKSWIECNSCSSAAGLHFFLFSFLLEFSLVFLFCFWFCLFCELLIPDSQKQRIISHFCFLSLLHEFISLMALFKLETMYSTLPPERSLLLDCEPEKYEVICFFSDHWSVFMESNHWCLKEIWM